MHGGAGAAEDLSHGAASGGLHTDLPAMPHFNPGRSRQEDPTERAEKARLLLEDMRRTFQRVRANASELKDAANILGDKGDMLADLGSYVNQANQSSLAMKDDLSYVKQMVKQLTQNPEESGASPLLLLWA
eukprot:CAMPEP_0179251542 /NCGR_PEP_ID=MMETSP0797-20121207/21741_1 /TAXON_ID=47934 /ORGANISM="Dinophysis acuminata, Strain DAEP01" /LENGTH=130 /DNA_ID=CAMNT_0020959321 /DNA_START=39 /DNA_END=428 /DNA_ORIENTATION=+